jgi:hypothetical protein
VQAIMSMSPALAKEPNAREQVVQNQPQAGPVR